MCSCINNIVYARFEGFGTFLCVSFMSVVQVFVRLELWVKMYWSPSFSDCNHGNGFHVYVGKSKFPVPINHSWLSLFERPDENFMSCTNHVVLSHARSMDFESMWTIVPRKLNILLVQITTIASVNPPISSLIFTYYQNFLCHFKAQLSLRKAKVKNKCLNNNWKGI